MKMKDNNLAGKFFIPSIDLAAFRADGEGLQGRMLGLPTDAKGLAAMRCAHEAWLADCDARARVKIASLLQLIGSAA
jgi:hypothetical protein